VFDDGAASEIEVEPPSRVLEEAVKELMNTGEGKMGRKLEVSLHHFSLMIQQEEGDEALSRMRASPRPSIECHRPALVQDRLRMLDSRVSYYRRFSGPEHSQHYSSTPMVPC
jgi:hypothetical protein